MALACDVADASAAQHHRPRPLRLPAHHAGRETLAQIGCQPSGAWTNCNTASRFLPVLAALIVSGRGEPLRSRATTLGSWRDRGEYRLSDRRHIIAPRTRGAFLGRGQYPPDDRPRGNTCFASDTAPSASGRTRACRRGGRRRGQRHVFVHLRVLECLGGLAVAGRQITKTTYDKGVLKWTEAGGFWTGQAGASAVESPWSRAASHGSDHRLRREPVHCAFVINSSLHFAVDDAARCMSVKMTICDSAADTITHAMATFDFVQPVTQLQAAILAALRQPGDGNRNLQIERRRNQPEREPVGQIPLPAAELSRRCADHRVRRAVTSAAGLPTRGSPTPKPWVLGLGGQIHRARAC